MDKSKVLVKQILEKIEGAYSPSTIRAYRSDFECFARFCHKNDKAALPAESGTIVVFIANLRDLEYKSSTIRRAVAAVSTLHRLSRLPDPTKDPDVQIEMRRMYRRLGRGFRQAEPIDLNRLTRILGFIPNDLRGVRDRALLLVAYDTLLGRSELVAIELKHLSWPDGGKKILLEFIFPVARPIKRVLAPSCPAQPKCTYCG